SALFVFPSVAKPLVRRRVGRLRAARLAAVSATKNYKGCWGQRITCVLPGGVLEFGGHNCLVGAY
ncbi:unnamed protein product, partial [Phaeothamnion confervicola]